MDTLRKYWVFNDPIRLIPDEDVTQDRYDDDDLVPVYLAADVDAVLAAKDAELARFTTIAEEQRLREYKLVESLQAAKSELARVLHEQAELVKDKQTLSTGMSILRTDLEQAKAQVDKLRRGIKGSDFEIAFLDAYLDEFKTLRSERDRAEAAGVELREVACKWLRHSHGQNKCEECYALEDEAEKLIRNIHPGQCYLDLAKLVEGLPVLTDKAIEEVQWDIVGSITTCEDESEHEWTQAEADALSKLLAWRAKEL